MVILEQVSVNPRAPVPTFARRKRRAHEYLQLAVALRTCRFRPPLPGVEPAARHAQTPAEQLERVVCLLRRDEAKLHRRSFAKKAAAFFRISRSSRRIRFSFRRRASSSRSAVVRPVLPCVRSARARLTQARSAVSVRSRSRAARPTLLPSSSTSRTAWALKSSSNCRRGRRRLGVSAIARDIVSTFRKMSTKPDQAQAPRRDVMLRRETGTEWSTAASLEEDHRPEDDLRPRSVPCGRSALPLLNLREEECLQSFIREPECRRFFERL